jgi:hypothetical protein
MDRCERYGKSSGSFGGTGAGLGRKDLNNEYCARNFEVT